MLPPNHPRRPLILLTALLLPTLTAAQSQTPPTFPPSPLIEFLLQSPSNTDTALQPPPPDTQRGGPPTFPIRPLIEVLVQSPADTDTALQVICLFESTPQTPFHGALAEIDQRLRGLLTHLRESGEFKAHLGDTRLIIPREGTITAERLLLIGLGDPETFTPERMEAVAPIVVLVSEKYNVHHPDFAPAVLDGGVTKFSTGEVAQHFALGLRRAVHFQEPITNNNQPPFDIHLSYLAGPTHAAETQCALDRPLIAEPKDSKSAAQTFPTHPLPDCTTPDSKP